MAKNCESDEGSLSEEDNVDDIEDSDDAGDGEPDDSHGTAYPVTQRCSGPKPKRLKTQKSASLKSGVRSYKYMGKNRQKKGGSKEESNQPSKKPAKLNLPDHDRQDFTEQSSNVDIQIQGKTENEGVDIEALLEAINFEDHQYRPKTALTWQEHQTEQRLSWQTNRQNVVAAYVSFLPHTKRACDNCFSLDTASQSIRCLTCRQHLCWKCDLEKHVSDPFHRRILVNKLLNENMKPTQFFKKDWQAVEQELSIPLFVPSCCENCSSIGSLRLIPDSQKIVVVTMRGRFDLNAGTFSCTICSFHKNADKLDYVKSSFWPGDCENPVYLFSEEVLSHFHHTQHRTPGSSESKFLETLEEASKECGRIGTINRALFARACQEWAFRQHFIEVEIEKVDKMDCPPCGQNPLSGSSDANCKLRHLKSAGSVRKSQNERPSLEEESNFYGDLAITGDEVVRAHRDKIYSKIKRTTKQETCEGVKFKAAKIDASPTNKYDITGLIISACPHGMIRGGINMQVGETFTHTHFMHKLCSELNCRYFCYDVACRYWDFARKVGYALPEFRCMTSKMKCFLPMMHARAHHLRCQFLFNPHWKKGNGMTHGEEHEQIFSKLSRYAFLTKRMRTMRRHNHLSEAIFYWNRCKMENMQTLLAKRLRKAENAVPDYSEKLDKLLMDYSLDRKALPQMYRDLRFHARLSLISRLNKSTPLDKLKRNLEGLYVQMKNTQKYITTIAEHAKARFKFRKSLSQTKAKARKVINLINGHATENYIDENSFNKGEFPWDATLDSDPMATGMTVFNKYSVVDCWMRMMRAQEEIGIVKSQVANLLGSLRKKRDLLQSDIASQKDENQLTLGQNVLKRAAIARQREQIRGILVEFGIFTTEDFRNFFAHKSDVSEMPDESDDSDSSDTEDSGSDGDSFISISDVPENSSSEDDDESEEHEKDN